MSSNHKQYELFDLNAAKEEFSANRDDPNSLRIYSLKRHIEGMVNKDNQSENEYEPPHVDFTYFCELVLFDLSHYNGRLSQSPVAETLLTYFRHICENYLKELDKHSGALLETLVGFEHHVRKDLGITSPVDNAEVRAKIKLTFSPQHHRVDIARELEPKDGRQMLMDAFCFTTRKVAFGNFEREGLSMMFRECFDYEEADEKIRHKNEVEAIKDVVSRWYGKEWDGSDTSNSQYKKIRKILIENGDISESR